MAIKLYKSQLEPTTKSSNVENRAFASMAEAGSIGRAFKGMVQSGEKLYHKHLDIKSDNEVLEKSKEVMNGSDTFEGLSSITLKASQMSDPDAALKYYNDAWQQIFDGSSSNLSPMAQKKFKHWMTKQNIKDAHSIKVQATTNMINSLRTNKLDQIETLKKSIIFGASLESETAKGELATIFSDKKTTEIFGNKLDGVIKSTNRDIAFYGYKNTPLSERDKVLEAALKDDRINDEDYLKLKTHFESKKSSTNYKNRNDVNNMQSNMESGLPINTDEFETAVAIALETQDEKTLLKLEKIRTDAPIYAQLSTMSVAEIENRVNILTEYKNTNKDGMELNYANNLNISKKYLAALTTSLNKDQLMTGNDRGVVNINEIGFEKLLTTGDVSEFASDIKERIAQAKTVADHYKRPVVFFTTNEKTAIQGAFESATTSDQIINLSTALVQGFGQDSDLAFQELSKDNTFLAQVGGLVMSNNGVPGNNVRLGVQGYMMFKDNPDLVKAYKVKSTDNNYLTKIGEYNEAFIENSNTFNSTVEMANYIFAAELKNSGKSIGNLPFNWVDHWEKAFKMAAGGTFITEGRNHWKGGFDEWNGNKVHIPNWIREGKFDDVVELLKDNLELVDMASSNDQAPVDVTGKTINNIFENQDPYFVSVGDGLYKIAMGENPKEFGAEEEYAMSSDGGYFVINLNKIKEDIITSLK
jgi:putative sterol carrier protein